MLSIPKRGLQKNAIELHLLGPGQLPGNDYGRGTMELVWEVAGWAGAGAILGAYLAVSMGWLKTGRAFQSANLVGACAFIINSAFHGAWPSVATNVAWFLISAVALFRMRADYGAASGEAPPVQLPGVPDTTGQLAVIEPPRAACSA
jgi:NhaP-type Na+/H+ or K+/H+ antiporter